MAGRIFLTFMVLIIGLAPSRAQPPDIILLDGKIFTANRSKPFVQALAIRDDLIIETGSTDEISLLAGPGTRIINLAGRTVIPGINDAHYHFTPDYDGYTIQLPEKEDGNRELLFQKIRDAVSRVPAGEFIYASLGVKLGTDTLLNRAALDRVAPGNPVILEGFWGHTIILNSKALNYFDIHEETTVPEGGSIEKRNGKLTGWFFGNACNLVRFQKPVSEQKFRKGLEKLGTDAGFYGITTIQNICSNADTSRFAKALSEMMVPVKIRLIHWGTYTRPEPDTTPRRFNPFVKLSGVKYLFDGTPIEGNALLSNGYQSRPISAFTHYQPSRIAEISGLLGSSKEQPLFHVVGDSMINITLNALSPYSNSLRPRRIRLEHADGLYPEKFQQVKELNAVVTINPSHSTVSQIPSLKLKGRFLKENSPAASLLRAGIPVAIGSDGLLNPYLNIMFAVTHPRPTERLSREEAVIAYTRGSAYAEHEDKKGILAEGMVADMAVLNADIFTIPVEQLPTLHSTLTILSGRIVYRAGYKKAEP